MTSANMSKYFKKCFTKKENEEKHTLIKKIFTY